MIFTTVKATLCNKEHSLSHSPFFVLICSYTEELFHRFSLVSAFTDWEKILAATAPFVWDSWMSWVKHKVYKYVNTADSAALAYFWDWIKDSISHAIFSNFTIVFTCMPYFMERLVGIVIFCTFYLSSRDIILRKVLKQKLLNYLFGSGDID